MMAEARVPQQQGRDGLFLSIVKERRNEKIIIINALVLFMGHYIVHARISSSLYHSNERENVPFSDDIWKS